MSAKKSTDEEATRKSLGWADELPEVQEALWLRVQIDAIAERLRDPKLPPGERARLLAKVRTASQAVRGIDLTTQRDRFELLVDALEVVTREAPNVVADGASAPERRSALAQMLVLALNDEVLSAAKVSNVELADAAESWPDRGASKWRAFTVIAKAVGAVDKDTDEKSVAERANRVMRARRES